MFIVAIHLELPYIFIHVEDVLGFDVQSHSSFIMFLNHSGGWGVVFPVYLWLIVMSQFGIYVCFFTSKS